MSHPGFHHPISNDPGSTFTPEKDRYHLYTSLACPYSQRTIVMRALKGLEDIIGLSITDCRRTDKGLKFSSPEEMPGCIPDTVNNFTYVYELYQKADPKYDKTFTVPILWDKKLGTIVNNESPEIMRIFDKAFDKLCPEENQKSYYPEPLCAEIDEIDNWTKFEESALICGITKTQKEYDENVAIVFGILDKIEETLSKKQFLTGTIFTGADIRLWPMIVRFDPICVTTLKCNLKLIRTDYPNILRWAREIYQMPKIADTLNMHHCKLLLPPGVDDSIIPIYDGPECTIQLHHYTLQDEIDKGTICLFANKSDPKELFATLHNLDEECLEKVCF
ncbi:hypothetical protein Glove_174g127 [Diversispora epigaea]|uniref:GST C-terminal domain-containing protein n=1 Tax=Diversispora epigaea TaxID=1348612 RepID=A0A397INZ2_9GLOM|nr:hypothetical protein Glove_174g127 [Diversispora epigaea]